MNPIEKINLNPIPALNMAYQVIKYMLFLHIAYCGLLLCLVFSYMIIWIPFTAVWRESSPYVPLAPAFAAGKRKCSHRISRFSILGHAET